MVVTAMSMFPDADDETDVDEMDVLRFLACPVCAWLIYLFKVVSVCNLKSVGVLCSLI